MVSIWTLAMAAGMAGAGGDFGFQAVRPQVLQREIKDVPDIWVLDIQFRNPRYIPAEIPGSGRELVWYMTYKIINHTGAERQFIPRFTLVTDKGEIFHDVIVPRAEAAVRMREDPTNAKSYSNSVTISREPIPPSEPEAAPHVRYGVAFWRNPPLEADSFTIYVTGLSNGYVAVHDPKTGQTELRRKTLKLEFTKPGDDRNVSEKEIRFSGDPTWIYR